MDYKSAYMQEMDRRGIKYKDAAEHTVRVSYRGDNTDDIAINVIFDEDGDGLVALRCWSFGKVPASRRETVLEACNTLNTKYRWVKFYIDNDGDIAVAADAVIDIATVGAECCQLVNRMVDIYDNGYPILMKACWS